MFFPEGDGGGLKSGTWLQHKLKLVPDALTPMLLMYPRMPLLSLSSESQISETCHHITGRYMAAYGLQFQKLPGSEICRPHHIATDL